MRSGVSGLRLKAVPPFRMIQLSLIIAIRKVIVNFEKVFAK